MPRLDSPVQRPFAPFWQSASKEITLYHGDVIDVLRKLPAKSVHCVISSPPYWGLRSYATGDQKHLEIGSEPSPDCGTHGQAQCGACFVCTMVKVYREVWRVLRDDGTNWINLGDSYAGSGTRGKQNLDKLGERLGTGGGKKHSSQECGRAGDGGLAQGNLLGIPWRVALALQADGWILRSDIPWIKRSPMPESVTNRPTKSLEYVYLFVKKLGYYFDMEAVRQKHVDSSRGRGEHESNMPHNGRLDDKDKHQAAFTVGERKYNPAGRNFRNADLWFQSISTPHGLVGTGDELVGLDVTSQAFKGAHYATFPCKLVEPMILAGTSAKGCCAKCGAPWKRVCQVTPEYQALLDSGKAWRDDSGKPDVTKLVNRQQKGHVSQVPEKNKTIGWQPTCECHGKFEKRQVTVQRPKVEKDLTQGSRDRSMTRNRNGLTGSLDGVERETEAVESTQLVYIPSIPLERHPIVPCTLLDPFAGTMTIGCMGIIHGRRSIGIDLSERYLKEHAIPRCQEYLRQAERNKKEIARLSGGRKVDLFGD